MSAAKKYIVSHMEKYCGPLYCLPVDVRDALLPSGSDESSKTFRFYFSVFCARNHIPVDLCMAYGKVYGIIRGSFAANHVRRTYSEVSNGMHLDYYAFICDANSGIDPANGKAIQTKFICGKTTSYYIYNEQQRNRAAADERGGSGYHFSM